MDMSRKNCLEVNVGVLANGVGRASNGDVYKGKSELKKDLNPKKEEVNVKDKEKEATTVKSAIPNGDNKMVVQPDNNINDGADEQMLSPEENAKLAEKREEVKFIKGDQQNGDAKIDIITSNGKSFTGMTKEELMKYANDPFWIRLRWIFFILFWAIWVCMLVGAILIIIGTPKCAAPEPLPWYKRGLLAKFNNLEVGANDLKAAKKVQASGVIYELPAELTYSVKEPQVDEKIKNIVAQYKDSKINVILDLTPNYVTKDSEMMRNALADETKRSAFVWIEKPVVPNNWLSIVNGSAWAEVQRGNFVLSQFGDNLYDLHMNDTIVKKALSDVLNHLLSIGVKGFRFKNTKFFLLTKNIQDEVPSRNTQYDHTQYGFWTHSQTTFQEGLGEVLYEYMAVVKNVSADAFLSVADDVVYPEVYQTYEFSGHYGIDMPMYGHFPHSLGSPQGRDLHAELLNTIRIIGDYRQWNLADISPDSRIDPSALTLFMSLLPGVPVVPAMENSVLVENVTENVYKHIEQLRLSPSYMHGDFHMHSTASDALVVYTRIKSGNPGYFVAFNPTDVLQKGNFTNKGLPDKMTVLAVSDNYHITDITEKSRMMTDKLEVSPYATIILTYVPVKTE